VQRGLPLSRAIWSSAAGYLLETPSIRRYETMSHPRRVGVVRDKPTGADNQQERPRLEQWVVGFVDGEGCFSISVVRNASCRLGWQVQHEFSVCQAAPSRSALEDVRDVFGCGRIVEQTRHDNHRTSLLRFSVKRRRDLVDVVVPFFEQNPLRTAKRLDAARFGEVLHLMELSQHLTAAGLCRIASITEEMNRRQPSRFLESSEAIRQPPHVNA
jgi:LAGLIDADG endonuclease